MQTFNKINTILLVTGLLLTADGIAQDYHLSHYDAAPLYLNPALTGMSKDIRGDYRITSDFRSQWKSIGIKPFKTFYVGYDMPIEKKENRFGVGGYIINHRAGIGQFNTFSLMASGSYDITKGKKNPHIFKTGLQLGFLNKAYAQENFTFNEQYNTSTGEFDQTTDNREDFQKASIFKFDAAFGLYYKYLDPEEKYTPSAGLALQHITMPDESFTAYKSKLPIRYTFHTDCKININEKWDVTPKLLFMLQARATEFNFGAQGSYKIDDNFKVLPGIWYRNKDALILDLAFQFTNNYLRFSYDINTSYLNSYSGGRGAFEISLILVGKKGEPLVPVRKYF